MLSSKAKPDGRREGREAGQGRGRVAPGLLLPQTGLALLLHRDAHQFFRSRGPGWPGATLARVQGLDLSRVSRCY